MKDHINEASSIIHRPPHHCHSHCHSHCRSPFSPGTICLLVTLFLVGLCVSTFILIVIPNAVFFMLLLYISTLVSVFMLWNPRNGTSCILRSFRDSDLTTATHGQLVKITVICEEGSTVSVMGILGRNNHVPKIVHPEEILTTGCLWQNCIFPWI